MAPLTTLATQGPRPTPDLLGEPATKEEYISSAGTSTRRSFPKKAGLVTGGAALTSSVLGALGAGDAEAAPVAWDQTADVVIVGGGGAALAAAIEARGAGASVIVLEKAAATGGTSALSGGIIQAAGTTYQKQYAKYQDDTLEKHYQTWLLEGEGLVDEDLIKDRTAALPDHIAWLVDLGMVVNGLYGHRHVPYLDKAGVMADRIHLTEGGGAQLAAILLAGAQAAGATIQTSAEVTTLVTDGANGVVGVMAKGPSGDVNVGANKGVIIATSSIDHNAEMAQALNAQQCWNITSQQNFTLPTNTGDGIRMGMQVGAALAGFGGTIDYEFTAGLGGSNASPQLTCVCVNGRGRRFVC